MLLYILYSENVILYSLNKSGITKFWKEIDMLFSFGCVTYHSLVGIMEKLLTAPRGTLLDTTKH